MPQLGETKTINGVTGRWDGTTWRQAGSAAPQTPHDLNPNVPEMYQADQWDSPLSAGINELGRTAKEAALGVARSPWDIVKGVLGMPGQVVKGYKAMIDHPDPSLLMDAPAAITQGIKSLGDNPREAGSLLGQFLLAPKVPEAANTALAEGPTVVGRGMSAVGRGMEAAGTSKLARRGGTVGAFGELMTGHPAAAVATAALPPALEYGGRALQRGGEALNGLDLSIKGRVPPMPQPDEPIPPAPEGFTPQSTEVKGYSGRPGRSQKPGLTPDDVMLYHEHVVEGMDPTAALRVVAGPNKASQTVLQGLIDAGDQARAMRASRVEPNAFTGNSVVDSPMPRQASVQRMDSFAPDLAATPAGDGLSPIDRFYQSDPQARVGGEGRMTGQFEEGEGGLSDLAAGKITPLSPLDELAQMSGRRMSAPEMQALLDKFPGWTVK